MSGRMLDLDALRDRTRLAPIPDDTVWSALPSTELGALFSEVEKLRRVLSAVLRGSCDDHDQGPCRYCDECAEAEYLLTPGGDFELPF